MTRVIAHVDMDAYFASVEQALDPRLRGRPVIVCGNPRLKTVVAAASYEAKRFGVKSGMSLPEALALCPDARLVEGDPIRYAETSRRIFALLSSFATALEIFSIDEAFLDVTATADLLGGKRPLAEALKRAVRQETGLPCSVGVAPNKMLAKIAASLVKPDGLAVLEPDAVAAFMERLPAREVPGIGPRLSALLSDWGLETCGQLRAAGERFFIERFGVRGKFLHEWACGRDDSPVVAVPPPPKSIGHSYTLPRNTSDPETLRSVLFRLSEQVAERMRRQRYRGRVIVASVRTADFFTFTRRKKYREIPADGRHICALAEREIAELPVEQDVRLLGVSVAELFPAGEDGLFKSDAETREELFGTVDTINRKHGEGSLVPATILVERLNAPPVVKTHAFNFWRFKKQGGVPA